MEILIDKIRIKNFRALKDVEVNLTPITILVGANNSGKTTLLRAINSVLGITRNQINQDDLFIDKNGNYAVDENGIVNKSITIDVRIVPCTNEGIREDTFNNKWGQKLGSSIQPDGNREVFAFRTIFNFGIEDSPTTAYYLFSNWENEQLMVEDFKGINQIRNNIKMYFIDAQRDILEDSKQRTSFFGKLVSNLDYGDDLKELKEEIAIINKKAIEKSAVLKHLKDELKKLNQTTKTQGEGITLNPFPKKISDLHKGMKVYFQDNQSDSFSMENHGMGTRSWASIITAGAFSSWEVQQALKREAEGGDLYFPLFALEEPEAHLHPNAQRTLYKQLKDFKGQKIVSTHSPYIAGQAELEELRHFYKVGDASMVSEILFDKLDRDQISELENAIELEGKSKETYLKYQPQIDELKNIAIAKLSEGDRKDLVREIFLNKGELLFSKALLLFEGQTEEITMPIFYNKYFGRLPFEDGVTLVSVGGKLNYSPFLKFAKFLNIPVFILSDGDDDTEDKVKKQINKIYENIENVPLCVLPNNSDFEQFLFDSGFKDEILNAIDKVKMVMNHIEIFINELNGQNGKKGVRDYNGEEGKVRAIVDCMRGDKTEFPYDIAINIVESGKPLPDKLNELFNKISEILNLKIEENE
jgi:putative ATP-dependent endonuclease of OLD family